MLFRDDFASNWQPFEWNTSCVNSILQMLKSIPEIAEMISSQTYKLSNHTGAITEICDEIYNIFQTEGVVDTVDLRAVLGYYSTNPQMFYSDHQNLEVVFFREFWAAVKSELIYSDASVIDTWNKFTSGDVNFLELPSAGNKMNSLKTITDVFNQEFSEIKLPEYLFVKVPESLQRNCDDMPPRFYPENQMMLQNGDAFTLTCIVSKDLTTGQYSTAITEDNSWTVQRGSAINFASKDDVKTSKNYAYLYVKKEINAVKWRKNQRFFCKIPGCPMELGFKDEESLQSHIFTEHKKCLVCGEEFFFQFMYKEHLNYCKNPADDSGHESMNDEEEKCKSISKKQYLKRKNSSSEIEVVKKKPRANEDIEIECDNEGCKMKGLHFCLFPPVTESNGIFQTSGSLNLENSVFNGVSYYTSFNNSFMNSLCSIFLFKYNKENKNIKIKSYCSDSSKVIYYELDLYENGLSSSVKGKVGEERKLAAFGFNSSIIYFDIKLSSS